MLGANDFLYFSTLAFSLPWVGIILYCLARLAFWKPPNTDSLYRPSVSVVIAAWKEGRRIIDVVESVRAQKYPREKVEIIVVGGGDDETLNVCKQLRKKGKIKFLEEKKRSGKWKALNRGIALAKGSVIAFTDADCVACSDWLENLVSSLSRKDVMGVLGNVEPLGKNFISRAYSLLLPIYNMFSFLAGIPFFCGWCSAFKREVFRKAKFRESAVEDFVFITDVRRNKEKIVFCEDAKVKHRFPLTFGGLVNAHLRVVVGIYRSMFWHPVVMFGFFTSIFGAITSFAVAYGYLNPDQNIALPYTSLLSLIPVGAALYYMKKFGKLNYLKKLLDVVALIFILNTINIVSAALFLTGRKVEWKIYKK